MLVDPAGGATEPRVMFIIEHVVREGAAAGGAGPPRPPRTVSQRMQFIQVDAGGDAVQGGYAPYLDYRPATAEEVGLVGDVLGAPWLSGDLEGKAVAHAAGSLVPEHFNEVRARQERIVDATLRAVHERLVKEINDWSNQAVQLQLQVSAGRQPQVQPENARRRAEELTARLRERQAELEAKRHVVSSTPLVIGGALVIPQALLEARRGAAVEEFAEDPEARARIERAAMRAVMEKERAAGNEVEDVSAQKCGWDVTVRTPDGGLKFVEVKGRVKGARTVTVTRNEILTSLNQPDKFVLAVVLVDGEEADGPHYIRRPFSREPEFGVTSVNYDLGELMRLRDSQ